MDLLLVAPFRIKFDIDYSLALSDRQGFFIFQKSLENNLNNDAEKDAVIVNLAYNHEKSDYGLTKFILPEVDCQQLLGKAIFEIGLDITKLSKLDSLGDIARNNKLEKMTCENITVKIYGNTFAVFEMLLHMEGSSLFSNYSIETSCLLNQINDMVSHVISEININIIEPFVEKILKFQKSENQKYYHKKSCNNQMFNESLSEENGKPLWVHRVVFNTSYVFKNNMLDGIIVPAHTQEEINNHLRSWGVYFGNAGSISSIEVKSIKYFDIKETMSIAQFYYASLYTLNAELLNFFGSTNCRKTKRRSLKDKRNIKILDGIIASHDLTTSFLNDTVMNLQGFRKKYLSMINESWDVVSLKKSLKEKIDACQRSVNTKHNRIIRLSRFSTETILFIIASVAFIDFFKEMAYVSRQLASNPGLHNVYMSDRIPGLMDIGVYMEPDRLIWIGIGIALFLFLVFVAFLFRYYR